VFLTEEQRDMIHKSVDELTQPSPVQQWIHQQVELLQGLQDGGFMYEDAIDLIRDTINK